MKEVQRSKYSHLFSLTKQDYDENYYDLIRLAYIGMFHKFENFIKELIRQVEEFFSDVDENEKTLVEYAKERFNFKIIDWKHSPITERINWIAICNKHYDGFPTKEPVHERYKHLNPNSRMALNRDDFKHDIEMLISSYQSKLSIVMMIAMHKMSIGNWEISDRDILNEEGINEKYLEADANIQKLIDLDRGVFPKEL